MGKYNIKTKDLKAFFATADMALRGHYHEVYAKLGLIRGKNKNWHCIESEGHSHGQDLNPSMSIDNEKGLFRCHCCGISGNLQSFWTKYLKGNSKWGDSYSDFIVDTVGSKTDLLNFSENKDDPFFEKNSKFLRQLYDAVQAKNMSETGRPYMLHGEITKMIRDMTVLPMKDLNKWVENLLTNKEAKEYLYRTRRITDDIIKRYRIGWFEHKGISANTGKPFSRFKYIFSYIDAEGNFINAKAYDPSANDPAFKWMYPFKGRDICPVPINNFTKQKIYFFEGEPDLYCALSMEYEGSVTMGSQSIKDVNIVFGEERAKQLLTGKEVVICFDCDEKAKKFAKELAESMYPYVKQIKIIDLDKSDMNPFGLDPEKTKEVTIRGKSKIKRIEKDFTDYMKINGFSDLAKERFNKLVEDTPVFTMNVDRKRRETFKVTLQEARMSRYFSSDRTKELELVASVGDFNCNAYMYPNKFLVTCKVMQRKDKKKFSVCENCEVCKHKDFDFDTEIEYELVRESPNPKKNQIEINDHNILGLIEVTDSQKRKHLKSICEINERCSYCTLLDTSQKKLIHVRLANDADMYNDSDSGDTSMGSSSEIDIEAYIAGDSDIYPNKTYRFLATQTTAWNNQNAVLFIHKAEPIQTSIESFKMDQDTHDLLKIFQPLPGESIKDHMARRYNVFANAAGVTGRRELFFLNDLSYFSAIEINNKMLPAVPRGWVEVLIAGDPRTCKTMISKFLMQHYKVGTIISGSSAVSRSGLIGGISFFNKKSQISWGQMPANDGGTVIIDEMSDIPVDTMTDMTDLRSEGIASVHKILSAKARARVRKIMLSNPRGWKEEEKREYNYGIQFLKDLCLKDKILARFDVAFYVKKDDVKVEDFKPRYEEITTDFTEYQCRHLIMWAHSRKVNDIIFEDGFDNAVNNYQNEMCKKYHSTTQLVNQEMRAKLVRLSTSLATLLYSHKDDDWNKIVVKKIHLDYIVEFLNYLYCHENMKMDHYSLVRQRSEKLGDMKFMMNISKYIDLNPLFQEDEFTEKSIGQIFYDYLQRVSRCEVYIPDAKTDKILTNNLKPYDCVHKLIGILTARNCVVRHKKGIFKKTNMFNKWLERRISLDNKAEQSNILELESNKSNIDIVAKAKQHLNFNIEVEKLRARGLV